jgi:ribokinase
MPQVIALGDINVDFIAHIPYYPQPGGGGVARQARLYSGGSAANTALVLARCGMEVGLIARVGRDALAAQTVVELLEAGVDGRQIQYDPERMTGTMFVAVTPDGERTMFGYRGANARLDPDLLQPAQIAHAQLLHISGYVLLESPQRDAALRALDIAHQAGLKVSLDVGVEVAQGLKQEVRDLLSLVDWIFPNELEAESLVGHADGPRAVERFLGYGLEAVILKLGEMGCVIGTGDGVFAVPAFGVQVMDTTGAGDSFDAGFIAGRLAGLSWRASGLLANALGALAASVDGAGESLPGPAEAIQLLNQREGYRHWGNWQPEIEIVRDFLEQVMSVERARAGARRSSPPTLLPQSLSWQGEALYG